MENYQFRKYSIIANKIINEASKYYVGSRDILIKVLAAMLVNGHILFEDHPGLGKTLLAKTISRLIDAKFTRVQFTPDLLPADILGTMVWRAHKGIFELVKGPIFTNILLADEINRAPPKTQSALLEAMEEKQVTIEGKTYQMDKPFIVLATQNPLEYEGTYPLPEAQLDRFTMRLETGYPSTIEEEKEIILRRLRWRTDDPTKTIRPIISRSDFIMMQNIVETKIYVDDSIIEYIATIIREIRRDPRVEAGPSPRGDLALLKLSRALAFIKGRDFVLPDDIKFIAIDSLAHRIVLKADTIFEGISSKDIIKEALSKVVVPKQVEE